MHQRDDAANLLEIEVAPDDELEHDARPEKIVILEDWLEYMLHIVGEKSWPDREGKKNSGAQPHGGVQHTDKP